MMDNNRFLIPMATPKILGAVKIGEGLCRDKDGTLHVISAKEAKELARKGKEMIASAITERGVQTESTDSFETMADNIREIDGAGTYGVPNYNLPVYGAIGISGVPTYLEME